MDTSEETVVPQPTQLRVLIMGAAGVGKTTILWKLCGETEKPIARYSNGQLASELPSLEPTMEWGLHDINIEITYPSLPGWVFHDSRGLEYGSEIELNGIREFLARRARNKNDAVHVIWYCVSANSSRPLVPVERRFLESELSRGNVSVIVIFTKFDWTVVKAYSDLKREGLSGMDAYRGRSARADQLFQTHFVGPLMDMAHPPTSCFSFGGLHRPGGQCTELIQGTLETLEKVALPQPAHLRILIVGAAGVGKTTILRKICSETEKPIVRNFNGQLADGLASLGPTAARGLHDINLEITYPSLPGWVFHESCGLESGSVNEWNEIREFLARGARNNAVDVIWYCICVNSCRPQVSCERQFFGRDGEYVPVIAIFTKVDVLAENAYSDLRQEGLTTAAAYRGAAARCDQLLQAHFVKPIMDMAYPPIAYFPLKNLHKPGGQCVGLIQGTLKTLEGGRNLRRMSVLASKLESKVESRAPTEQKADDIIKPNWVSLHLSTSDVHDIVIQDPTRPVGRGGFGDLFLGEHVPTGQMLAMKRPTPHAHTAPEVAVRRLAREANTWSGFENDNILPFYGLVEISNEVYLISPWMEYGDLSAFIKKRLSFLDSDTNHRNDNSRTRAYTGFRESDVIHGIASGLAYLHIRKVVHGDLKALNVLLTGELMPLICDFGLTKMEDNYNATSTAMKGAGSWRWMSPEVMDGVPKTIESDIYAFGMTIVEILTGSVPCPSLPDLKFVTAILNGTRPVCEPLHRLGQDFTTLWRVASACWVSDPSERPTAYRIVDSIEGNLPLILPASEGQSPWE